MKTDNLTGIEPPKDDSSSKLLDDLMKLQNEMTTYRDTLLDFQEPTPSPSQDTLLNHQESPFPLIWVGYIDHYSLNTPTSTGEESE
jgi:hypothetical protein